MQDVQSAPVGTYPAAQIHAGTASEGAPHIEPRALGMEAGGWVALSMIVVIAIMLWKKVPAAIGAALDRKIATIRTSLDDAQRLREEAEALRAEYEAKARAAEGEAAAIVAHAHDEADTIVAQARVDAASLIERRARMAEDKIAAAERTAIGEVRGAAAAAATTAAARIIAEQVDADADKPLVDRAIAGLDKRVH